MSTFKHNTQRTGKQVNRKEGKRKEVLLIDQNDRKAVSQLQVRFSITVELNTMNHKMTMDYEM